MPTISAKLMENIFRICVGVPQYFQIPFPMPVRHSHRKGRKKKFRSKNFEHKKLVTLRRTDVLRIFVYENVSLKINQFSTPPPLLTLFD